MPITFEWDRRKDAANRKKHGVDFDEARTVFADPLGRIIDDTRHSADELRLILLGTSVRRRLLTIMFTERGPDLIRIISARRATRLERRNHEEGWP